MLTRAHSTFEIKSIDEERRIVVGIASTPEVDRGGDEMDPYGAKFKLPLPFKWEHKAVVGEVFAANVTKAGIEIQASITKVDEPGLLKDQVDYAWQSIKLKLARGLSIGWLPIKATRNASGGVKVSEWDWLETSAVAIPMNMNATILAIKSLDVGLAATGTEAPREITAPGVTGTSRVVSLATKGAPNMKTYTEQLTDWKATRQTKTARMDELMAKSSETGTTLDQAQQDEHDTLDQEVTNIDAHIKRLEASEARAKSSATAVSGESISAAAAARGGHQMISVKANLPPGIGFARYAMCIALGKNSRMDALEIARHAYPHEQALHELLKAPIVPGTTGNTYAPLLQYTDWMGDFVEYLRPGTILGKFGTNGIPNLRRVPPNVRIMTQTAGGSAYWVGQGTPKPLTKGTYGTITLDFHKLATIAVLTEEEVKFVPSAEAKVRDDLRDAIAAEMDQAFVDPANAGTANVKPASVTNGVAATAVSGTDADAVRVDFKNLMSAFISANVDVSSPVLIMGKQIALNLSLMLNALGQREFPDISLDGGKLFGVPIITSEYLTSLGSPSTGMVILVNASDIYLADDGAVSVSASGEASLEMLDSSLQQDGSAGTGASLVSLWQNNLLGLRAERFVTWKKRRSTAAQYLSPVAYTPTT